MKLPEAGAKTFAFGPRLLDMIMVFWNERWMYWLIY
jgi:hypothetical protein